MGMMDDWKTATRELTKAAYRAFSPEEGRAQNPWQACLMEKIWIILMLAALTIAAVGAASADWQSDDDRPPGTAFTQVLSDIFVR
jgi:hypothetical protein